MKKLVEINAGELRKNDMFYIDQITTNCKPFKVVGFNLFGEPEYMRSDGSVSSIPADRKVRRNLRLIEILV